MMTITKWEIVLIAGLYFAAGFICHMVMDFIWNGPSRHPPRVDRR